MRNSILISFFVLTSFALWANSASVSPGARFLSTSYRLSDTPSKAPSATAEGENPTEYLPLLVRVDDETSPLPDFATELHRRGSIVICTVPADRVMELASAMGVRRLEAHASSLPTMTDARNFCGLPEIAELAATGNILYDGTGVVVGFTDIGFDPNHTNFLAEDGTPRVKKLVNYTTDSPLPVILTSPEEITAWTTDDPDETHATHVAGILAGSSTTGNMQGVAPGAEIVATTSPLYDAMMLAGCEEIIAYAQSVGKPAAINISVSSDIGPHDGTTLFNQYMASLTEDATVCISSGNEGKRTGFATGISSEDTPGLRTYFREYPTLSPNSLHGTVDLWSDSSEPFAVEILIQNFETGDIDRIPVPIDISAGQQEWLLCSPDISPGSIQTEEMPDIIQGYIHVVAELNPENNRYNVALNCNYTNIDPDRKRVLFGVEAIPATPATVIEMYSTPRIYFTRHHDKSAASLIPTSDRAVNDFCAGEGPICVGAMNSANTFDTLDGGKIEFSEKIPIGDVSYFSSYGTLANGRVLPDVCAPGAQLVSSLSWHYCMANPDYPQTLATIALKRDGRTDYWGPMQGTSMSSPYTAGVAALWLQANPDLTGKDIREIAVSTAASPTIDEGNSQWGLGVLDAYAGLKIARSLSGTDRISVDTPSTLMVKQSGTTLLIALPGSSISATNLISTDGRIVCRQQSNGDEEMTVECAGISPGIYVVEVYDVSGSRHCLKTVVR